MDETNLETGSGDKRGLLLAIDRSGAMAGPPAAAVLAAVPAFIARLAPTRRLGLIAFNGKVIQPIPLAPVRDGAYLNAVLGQIDPRGEADLSAAIERGISECRSSPPADLAVLTAGTPTLGRTRADQLERIARSAPSAGVRVFLIGLGDRPDRNLLEAVGRAGGGSFAIATDAEELESVLAGLGGVDA